MEPIFDLKDLVEQSYKTAVDHGWWEGERSFGDICALITTEVSEAFEEYRNGHAVEEMYFSVDKEGKQKPEGVPFELADVLIRIADYCGHAGIDLETAVKLKLEYNKSRPYRHGGKVA